MAHTADLEHKNTIVVKKLKPPLKYPSPGSPGCIETSPPQSRRLLSHFSTQSKPLVVIICTVARFLVRLGAYKVGGSAIGGRVSRASRAPIAHPTSS
jgi:hypothetical protein